MKVIVALLIMLLSSCTIERQASIHNTVDRQHKPSKDDIKVIKKQINVDYHLKYYFFRKERK